MHDFHATNRLLEQAALAYARDHLVFPCRPRSKEPATKNGFYAATRNPATIKRLWTNPNNNVAIRTGLCSHLFVLDKDPRNGGNETLAQLIKQHGPLPVTAVAETGGGGEHYYFRTDRELPSTSGVVGAGI